MPHISQGGGSLWLPAAHALGTGWFGSGSTILAQNTFAKYLSLTDICAGSCAASKILSKFVDCTVFVIKMLPSFQSNFLADVLFRCPRCGHKVGDLENIQPVRLKGQHKATLVSST